MSLSLRPEDIREYLRTTELPARRREPWGAYASEIIRYGSFVGTEIENHRHMARTMERARVHIDSCEGECRSVENGRIILAEQLSGPKGRFDRSWHAPSGGLWGCLVHANTLTPRSTMLLSLAVGIAACEAIRDHAGPDSCLRWINDVLIAGRKVAGFLIESHTGPRWGEQFHLIGFGINLNNTQFPGELEDTAVSLSQACGEPIDRTFFATSFFAKLTWNLGILYFIEADRYDRIAVEGGNHPILRRFTELTDTPGRRVLFGYDVVRHPQYTATAVGVGAEGGLRLLLDDGREVVEHSGEVRYL